MNDPVKAFQQEVQSHIAGLQNDPDVQALSRIWLREITPHKYAYNFSWMGRPCIQFPQDMLAMQELVWEIQPDVIVETGVAHGGSIVYYASLLAMCGLDESYVVGIDIDIRPHNREALEQHKMFPRMRLLEGSAIDPAVIQQVTDLCAGKKVLVVLDSMHTHEHVLQELRAYAPLVTPGSYVVVMDTLVEYMPAAFFGDRPWSPGNSPASAVSAFLQETNRFVVDEALSAKLLISAAPGGYLRCVEEGQA